MTDTCVGCKAFDHEAERKEDESLVRCLDERNRGNPWHKLVAAGYPACRYFASKGGSDAVR